MKKNLLKIFALSAMMTAFVACSDDDNNPTPAPEPAPTPVFVVDDMVAGTYTPAVVGKGKDFQGADIDLYFNMAATWKDGSTTGPMINGFIPVAMPLALASNFVSGVSHGGLVELQLLKDGKFAAKTKELIPMTKNKQKVDENGKPVVDEKGEPVYEQEVDKDGKPVVDAEGNPVYVQEVDMISTFLNTPSFKEEVNTFPGADAESQAMAEGFRCYTEDGKFFFAVMKDFIDKAAAEAMGPNFSAMLESMIKENNLPVVVEEKYFAIPVKYTVEGNKLTLSVDRDMMMPYKDFIVTLAGMAGEVEVPIVGKLVPADIVKLYFDETTAFDIVFGLQK